MSRATYHLWLKPSGTVCETLALSIRHLAKELGGPTFDPHVTLLGNLIGTEQEHIQRSSIAARQLRPFSITLSEVSYHNQYFQCLFMRVEESPPVMSAHMLISRIFEKPDETYMPHLSLAYGFHSKSCKMAAINKLSPDLRTSFEVTALFLIKAESNDPKDWLEIAGCPFAA